MGHKLDLPYLKKYIDPSTGKPMLNNKKKYEFGNQTLHIFFIHPLFEH